MHASPNEKSSLEIGVFGYQKLDSGAKFCLFFQHLIEIEVWCLSKINYQRKTKRAAFEVKMEFESTRKHEIHVNQTID